MGPRLTVPFWAENSLVNAAKIVIHNINYSTYFPSGAKKNFVHDVILRGCKGEARFHHLAELIIVLEERINYSLVEDTIRVPNSCQLCEDASFLKNYVIS